MIIKNRLFTYPVLCADTDDYDDQTDFSVRFDLKDYAHEILLKYDYSVCCDAMDTLLRNGSAQYVLHIECSTTSYRMALQSDVPHIEVRIPKNKVNGEIALVAMIVARKDIASYSCPNLNDDYIDESISFKKGSILAYQNLPPILVPKKMDELANKESFFTVIKQPSQNPDEIKPLSFNIDSDKIQILVDEKTYESYIKFQNSKNIAIAMFLMPALIFLKCESDSDTGRYREYTWYQRLTKFYQAQGKDFDEDFLGSDENPVMLAQEILMNPVSNAYRELFMLED